MLPFSLSGKVIHGQSLGHTFDSPTANITPVEDVSHLAFGVYFSVVYIDGRKYPAITNLGVRPTVSDDGSVNAETFIYGLDEDIYGKTISVTLLDFHRSEHTFGSVDELYDAVRADLREGAKYHGLEDY